MKVPKKISRYCSKCNTKTEHKLSPVKNKPRPKPKKRSLKWGVRQFARVVAGYGGSPRTKASKSKVSTHPVFKAVCEKCKKARIVPYKDRAKKVSQI